MTFKIQQKVRKVTTSTTRTTKQILPGKFTPNPVNLFSTQNINLDVGNEIVCGKD